MSTAELRLGIVSLLHIAASFFLQKYEVTYPALPDIHLVYVHSVLDVGFAAVYRCSAVIILTGPIKKRLKSSGIWCGADW
jgi:hypothetical protein